MLRTSNLKELFVIKII